ncbi:MAG: hypothetical protein QXU79_03775 [Candidatus Micrarchaeaceae archaeon]
MPYAIEAEQLTRAFGDFVVNEAGLVSIGGVGVKRLAIGRPLWYDQGAGQPPVRREKSERRWWGLAVILGGNSCGVVRLRQESRRRKPCDALLFFCWLGFWPFL